MKALNWSNIIWQQPEDVLSKLFLFSIPVSGVLYCFFFLIPVFLGILFLILFLFSISVFLGYFWYSFLDSCISWYIISDIVSFLDSCLSWYIISDILFSFSVFLGILFLIFFSWFLYFLVYYFWYCFFSIYLSFLIYYLWLHCALCFLSFSYFQLPFRSTVDATLSIHPHHVHLVTERNHTLGLAKGEWPIYLHVYWYYMYVRALNRLSSSPLLPSSPG